MKEGLLRKFIALVMILTTVLSGCQSMESNDLDMDYNGKIVADSGYSMAILPDGNLWGWGANDFYELGDGTTDTHIEPIMIMSDVVDVKTSNGQTMVLKTDGGLWGWAGAESSEYAGCTLTPSFIMDDVAFFTFIPYYFQAIAIKNDGSLWTWGTNYEGRLGNGATTAELLPIKLMDDALTASIQFTYTMVIKTDGSLWTWGKGRLGDGSTTERLTPVKIMEDVRTVSTGSSFTMASKTDGTLWAWGNNSKGQIGDGSTTERLTPVKIMNDIHSITARVDSAYAIKTDGSLWVWGSNTDQRLGTGTSHNMPSPTKIMENVDMVLPIGQHALAIETDGSIWAWGTNLGIDEAYASPKKILDDVVDVASSNLQTVAVRKDGSIWEWDNCYTFVNESPNKVSPDNLESPAMQLYKTLLELPEKSTVAYYGNTFFGLSATGAYRIRPMVELITSICESKGYRILLIDQNESNNNLLFHWAEHILHEKGAVYGEDIINAGIEPLSDGTMFGNRNLDGFMTYLNDGYDYAKNKLSDMKLVREIFDQGSVEVMVTFNSSNTPSNEAFKTYLACITNDNPISSGEFQEGTIKGYMWSYNDIEVLETLHYGSVVSFTGPREILPAHTMTK